MSFLPVNITLWSNPENPNSSRNLPQWWGYLSTTDTVATISANGYFNIDVNTLLQSTSFRVGDFIYAVGSDASVDLQITALTPNITTTSSTFVIQPDSVYTAAIQNLAVTTAKIDNLAVTAAKIANATITTTQISATAGITGGQLAAGTVTATQIANATITGAKLVNNTITATQIANATITTTQISATAGITGGQLATGTITSTQLAANAVVTAAITDANVTLAKLAAGITPSHVVKFGAQYTTVGGAAAEAITIAGVLATDLVSVQLVAPGTNTVSVSYAVPTTNTLTVTFSADPGNDAIICYQVLRAVS